MSFKLEIVTVLHGTIVLTNFDTKITSSIRKNPIFIPLPNDSGVGGGGFGEDLLIFTEMFTIVSKIIPVGEVTAESVVMKLREIAKTDSMKPTLKFGSMTQSVIMDSLEWSLVAGHGDSFEVKIVFKGLDTDEEELVEE